MRLDMLLASELGIRKQAARELLSTGVVAVDGQEVVSASFQVILGGTDRVTVRGEELSMTKQFHRLLVVNKPKVWRTYYGCGRVF
jgi:16S rRNA U516 pseudouridylate synthase RsuA-like enzyme